MYPVGCITGVYTVGAATNVALCVFLQRTWRRVVVRYRLTHPFVCCNHVPNPIAAFMTHVPGILYSYFCTRTHWHGLECNPRWSVEVLF